MGIDLGVSGTGAKDSPRERTRKMLKEEERWA